MRLVSSLILPVILVASAAVAADMPPKIDTPSTRDLVRIDPATGAIAGQLERVMTVMEGGQRSYTFFLPEPTSSVAVPFGEQLMFVKRAGFKTTPTELAQAKTLLSLERLAVDKGKRYATKQFVPLKVTVIGELLEVPDERNPSTRHLTRAFVFTAPAQLPPGEYAISGLGGLITPWAGFGATAHRVDAFKVVPR